MAMLTFYSYNFSSLRADVQSSEISEIGPKARGLEIIKVPSDISKRKFLFVMFNEFQGPPVPLLRHWPEVAFVIHRLKFFPSSRKFRPI